MEWLRKTLKPGQLLLDVGANFGEWTITAAHLGAKACAIEPQQAYVDALNRLNHPRIHAHAWALSDAGGAGRLWEAPGLNNGASSLHPGMDWKSNAVVSRVRLDTVWPVYHPLQAIHGVKFDVEGHEAHAIQGSLETLTIWKPWVWVEENPEALARAGCTVSIVHDLLRGIGYNLEESHADPRMNDSVWDELWVHPGSHV